MALSIIKAETRLANMITWFGGIQKKITDFVVGGKTRTKFEAIAVEMEAQDLDFYRTVKRAIAVSVYRAFDFTLEAAVRASGNATFSATIAPSSDVTIPVGTQVATQSSSTATEKVYETTQEAVLLAGETSVIVPILCTVSGTAGNTGVGTITVMKNTISGINSVTNVAAITNGAAKETEAAREVRFRKYISTLAKGTDAAIEYGAETAQLTDTGGNVVEKVVQSHVGTVTAATAGFTDVFIYNGVGSTSDELVAQAQLVIDGYRDVNGNRVVGWKAAGVVATVRKAVEISQDVTAVLTLEEGYDSATIIAQAETIIGAYLSSFDIGQTFIHSELVKRIKSIDGVYDVSLSLPAANVIAQQLGSVTFTGTGLNDLTTGGSYTDDGRTAFVIEIDATGTPDTFRWSADGGDTWEASGVAITGAAQDLTQGVQVTFAATTGHTSGDQWALEATGAVVFTPGTIDVSEAA